MGRGGEHLEDVSNSIVTGSFILNSVGGRGETLLCLQKLSLTKTLSFLDRPSSEGKEEMKGCRQNSLSQVVVLKIQREKVLMKV